jgi:hypothetical protein
MTGMEEALFRACTTIKLGNGNKVKFWKDNWLNGQAPKDIALDSINWLGGRIRMWQQRCRGNDGCGVYNEWPQTKVINSV